MFPIDSLPETQAALALSIFFATLFMRMGQPYWLPPCRPADAWIRGSDS